MPSDSKLKEIRRVKFKCELCVFLSHIMDYLHIYYDKHIHERVDVSQGYG